MQEVSWRDQFTTEHHEFPSAVRLASVHLYLVCGGTPGSGGRTVWSRTRERFWWDSNPVPRKPIYLKLQRLGSSDAMLRHKYCCQS
jgi:hypothetical protein